MIKNAGLPPSRAADHPMRRSMRVSDPASGSTFVTFAWLRSTARQSVVAFVRRGLLVAIAHR